MTLGQDRLAWSENTAFCMLKSLENPCSDIDTLAPPLDILTHRVQNRFLRPGSTF